MTCSIRDWMGDRVGFVKCTYHNVVFKISERCPSRDLPHPFVAGGKIKDSGVVDDIFDKQFISNDKQFISSINVVSNFSNGNPKRKYVKKVRDSIWERFHNHGVKFKCVVAWDSLDFPVCFINRFSKYKRLDFDDAIVKVFRNSILVTLRSSAEIIHDDVRSAEVASINKIVNVLNQLPNSIVVSSSDLVNLHNAFVNHPAALYDVSVVVGGVKRLGSDRSKGNVEFEALDAKNAVDDSVLLEEDGTKKDMLELDYTELVETKLTRKFIAEALNSLVDDRKYYAENLKSHVGSVQDLGSGVNELINVIKELKFSNGLASRQGYSSCEGESPSESFSSQHFPSQLNSDCGVVGGGGLSLSPAIVSAPIVHPLCDEESRVELSPHTVVLPETFSFSEYKKFKARKLLLKFGWTVSRWNI